MRVFVSWSGDHSRGVAIAIKNWLPEVIQQVEPWVSAEDIAKGKRWSSEISGELEATSHGIICVTAENKDQPWLNFEAGALAKSLESSKVCPLLIDLRPQDLTGPLAEFQATSLQDESDMLRLVHSINAEAERPLSEELLIRSFKRAWPDLKAQFDLISSSQEPPHVGARMEVGRSSDDRLNEILLRIRTIERGVRELGAADEMLSQPSKALNFRSVMEAVASAFRVPAGSVFFGSNEITVRAVIDEAQALHGIKSIENLMRDQGYDRVSIVDPRNSENVSSFEVRLSG